MKQLMQGNGTGRRKDIKHTERELETNVTKLMKMT